jgi:primosomal protein N'
MGAEKEGKLKDIAALSSEAPVFDEGLLESLLWAANHYVAPLPVVLERSLPPNLPSPPKERERSPVAVDPTGALARIAESVSRGVRRPTTAVVGRWQSLDWLAAISPILTVGRSALIVTATEAEATSVTMAARDLGFPVTEVAGEAGRALTDAWVEAQVPGRLVVGTPRVAGWQIPGLALAVVLEEGRRAMKDRQTPTVHVRDLMTTRSRVEGFTLVFLGPTPTLEVLAAGPDVVRMGNRAWGLVEVVDRSEDQPGSGFLAERTVAAIKAMVRSGRRVFVFTHRRSADSSMRCVQCKRVRVCEACGSRLGREPACRRCGTPSGPCPRCGGTSFEEMGSEPQRIVAEIDRKVGAGVAVLDPSRGPVAVGTERDLASLQPVPLVVAVDVDGLMLGHNYRTSEEALRILARLAGAVEIGTGRRLMAQTSLPDSSLVAALRRGDPIPYLEGILAERARHGFPPATELLAIEVRGTVDPIGIDRDLRELDGGAVILGPAEVERGWRWLLQGSLGPVRLALRPLVQRWRDAGSTVRIDADPIDL